MGLKETKLVPGRSMDEIDRESYGAGPSPLDSRAVAVELRPARGGKVRGRRAAPSVVSLDGEWQLLQGSRPFGRDANGAVTEAGGWSGAIPARVPGSVHAALVAAGRLPDPTYGRNQELAEKESYKRWWLRTTFARPAFAAGGGAARLVFGGVCDACTIWLNGRKLGSHRGMFAPISFDVAALLRDENELIVDLDAIPSDPIPTDLLQERSNGHWRDTVVFNNVYGWHYSRCPSLGVWRPVRLEAPARLSLAHPYVVARDTSGNADLVVDLSGERTWEGVLRGTIEPANFRGTSREFQVPVRGRGEKRVHLRFQIPEPHLWWPNGMGRQDLYRMSLSIAAGADRREVDTSTFTFGLRTVQMAPFPEGPRPDRYDWTFVINGRPLFVKGTGWCTLDPLMDLRRERYDRFLSLARDQHCQMIRAWGCGMPETDDFYDLCDEYGIMVMQEWQTAWNSHNVQPFDLLEETIRQNTLRLRSRASLVMYGGGNESTAPFGRAIDMMGRLAIELDGTRPFHRGEPWGGSSHAYPCYWGREHLDEALRMEAPFWGEFGTACMPQAESVRRYTPADEQAAWPTIDATGGFAYHTPKFNTTSDISRLSQYARYFVRDDANLDHFCVASQLAQGVALRHPLERARTMWPDSTGALYYKMNDNFPAASWATADWYGAAKIGHYWVQDAFAPVHAAVLFNRLDHHGCQLNAPVYLLDNRGLLDGRKWTLLVRAFDGSLTEIERYSRSGTPSTSGPVHRVGTFTLAYGKADATPLFVVAEVRLGTRLVDRTFYILNFESERGCLFTRPRTSVRATVEPKAPGVAGGTGQRVLRLPGAPRGAAGALLTVTNTGSVPAIGVEISRPGHLDTFTASDNYFWLDAGESTLVTVSDSGGVTAGAWNAGTVAASEHGRD